MSLAVLQANVTKTGTFNGAAYDISGWSKPFDIKLKITALSQGKVALFQLQTSTDNFNADIRVEKVWSAIGQVQTVAEQALTPVHDWELHGFRAGTSSAKARIVLSYLDSSASVTYEAYGEGSGAS